MIHLQQVRVCFWFDWFDGLMLQDKENPSNSRINMAKIVAESAGTSSLWCCLMQVVQPREFQTG
jgi:hypothetical protein